MIDSQSTITLETHRLRAMQLFASVHAKLDLEACCTAIVRAAADICGTAVGLYLRQPDHRRLKLVSATDGSDFSDEIDASPNAKENGHTLRFALHDPNDGALIGVLRVIVSDSDRADSLESCIPTASLALTNALDYTRVKKDLALQTHEVAQTRRIDRELNDTMAPTHVFEITLDWVLRVTLADAASLALYDQATDALHYAFDLGYSIAPDLIAMYRRNAENPGGIAYRVAWSGHTEVIPDVSADSDYVQIDPHMRSHISVPVMREDRVIAVISVESHRFNAFTSEHIDFIGKLALRAGVAIDNARLYADAVHEREKLSLILGATSDAVIAVSSDDRLVLLNPAAAAALHITTNPNLIGQSVWNVWSEDALTDAFRRAKSHDQAVIVQLTLSDERTYHTLFTPHERIGWVIVMHDITEFKQMDQLKSDLITTVAHDLKQPLQIMNGYVELLTLHKTVNTRGERYVGMLEGSIQTMRQLIDDLLDLEKIERGLQLQIAPVRITQVIADCVTRCRSLADAKLMKLSYTAPSDLPAIAGDYNRLHQLFSNLVSNAIKYTPPEGEIEVWVERQEASLRIAVQDNGVGISPQDQTRIFDRFYRVKNVETESIEGSGVGLAIVKHLVDLHHGQIGIDSTLGRGTTFFVTLPLYSA